MLIIGIDEVGRGPLAGPLAVCAVKIPIDVNIDGITDSKKLSPKKREELFNEMIGKVRYSLGWVSADEIDDYGLSFSLKLAASKALSDLEPCDEKIITDGNIRFFPSYPNEETLVKADSKVAEVGAASIIAKVIRDKRMDELHIKYPAYNFLSNKGYGTKDHIEAIKIHGYSKVHRKSFEIK
jgi:ribonuclease HII